MGFRLRHYDIIVNACVAAAAHVGNLGAFLMIRSLATMKRARNATNETARRLMTFTGLGTAAFGRSTPLSICAVEPRFICKREREREREREITNKHALKHNH